jgi:hypothetical protein
MLLALLPLQQYRPHCMLAGVDMYRSTQRRVEEANMEDSV